MGTLVPGTAYFDRRLYSHSAARTMFGNLSALAEKGIGNIRSTINAIENDLDDTMDGQSSAVEESAGPVTEDDSVSHERQKELARRREELLKQHSMIQMEHNSGYGAAAVDIDASGSAVLNKSAARPGEMVNEQTQNDDASGLPSQDGSTAVTAANTVNEGNNCSVENASNQRADTATSAPVAPTIKVLADGPPDDSQTAAIVTRLQQQLSERGQEMLRLQEELMTKGDELEALLSERNAMRDAQKALSSRAGQEQAMERQTAELMAEGQKLMKQVQDGEAVIRKLRASLKGCQTGQQEAQERQSKLQAKLEKAQAQLEQTEADVKQLLAERDNERREHAETRARLEATNQHIDTERAAARAAGAELASVQHGEAAKAREMQLLDEQQKLRDSLQQQQSEAGSREDALRAEVTQLRRKWEGALAQVEEMGSQVGDATQPLLRQIRAMQADADARAEVAAQAEATLTDRLRAAKQAAAAAAEAKRGADARLSDEIAARAEVEMRSTSVQSEAQTLRDDVRQLEVRLGNAQQEIKKLCTAADEQERQSRAAVQQARRQGDALQSELAAAQEEAHRLRLELQGAQREHETCQAGLKQRVQLLERELQAGHENAILAQDEGSSTPRPARVPLAAPTDHPSHRIEAEGIRKQLQQRDAEIKRLQLAGSELQSSKDALADEMLAMAARVEQMSAQLVAYPALKKKLERTLKRHDALLRLFGERQEELDALKAQKK